MSNVATSMTTSRPIGTARSFWPSMVALDHRFTRRSLQPRTTMRQPREWHIAAKSATSPANRASSPIGSPLTTAKPSRVRYAMAAVPSALKW